MSETPPPSTKPFTRHQKQMMMQELMGTAPPPPPPPKTEDTGSVASGDSSDSNDPDYDPEDDSEDTSTDEDVTSLEEEDGEDDMDGGGMEIGNAFMPLMSLFGGQVPMSSSIMLMLPSAFPPMLPPPPPPPRDVDPVENESDKEKAEAHVPRKRQRVEDAEFVKFFNSEEKQYWKNLPVEQRHELVEINKTLKQRDTSSSMPLRFKLMRADIDPQSKALILAKLDQFQMMHEGSGEFFKLRNWLNAVSRVPFGKYQPLPLQPNDPQDKIVGFLKSVQNALDSKVFGHLETKNQILRILAQWISNPGSKGHCIGIVGSPGTGKTSLVKEGICKALGLPFGFVALGGAADGSFLEGHSFTYEGSTYGKIAEILMKTQCMNPVLFFDELDKVSGTRRGEEVIGILTHLTDSSQNERFQDRYFSGLDMNLSKALIIFSYNDEDLINPILKDRMITIRVKGYTTKDKICIARDYLIPEIMEQYKVAHTDVSFPNEVIEYIITRVNPEDGVRNLKRGLEAIISHINMHRYLPSDKEINISFPVTISEEHVRCFLRPEDGSSKMSSDVLRMMYI